ncbi:MAG TPA: DUF4292 domain-containing protein [Fermentimonas sp.]|nr:DUF4292 domain-containing protein [Fermentimonas sp.]
MKIPTYIYYITIILLFGSVIVSCKPKQKIVYSTTPVEKKTNSDLFNDIILSSIDYKTLTSRLNLNVTSGTRTLSSKATLRIVRDEAIQISIQPLFGVEMFRFYIDPVKVVLLDRMNKRYVKESIDSLKENYPVGFDFFTMQSMLTNAPFVTGKKSADVMDYKLFRFTQTSDLNYYLISEDPESDIEYSFTVNGDDRITFTHIMHHENKQSLQWLYDNFAIISESVFPHRMVATLSTKSIKINTELVFSGITINEESLNISMNIPNGYRKAPITEILKIIAPDQ